MKTYLIREIPEDLWREYKTACAWYGINIRAEFLRHMRNIVTSYYAAMKMKKPGPPAARARKEVTNK